MDEKQIQFFRHWQTILEKFISPLDVAENMSSVIAGKEFLHLTNTQEDLRAHELMEMLFASDSENIYDRFKEALSSCESMKWLHDLVFENLSIVDLAGHISQVENLPCFEKDMRELSPKLHHIKPMELLLDLRSLFSDHDWSKLKADVEKHGETTGLCIILLALPKRGPEWKTKFLEHIEEKNLRMSGGRGLIADTFPSIFNLTTVNPGHTATEEGVSSMDVDQPCTSASAKLMQENEDPSLQSKQPMTAKRPYPSNDKAESCNAKQQKSDEAQCSSDVQSSMTDNSFPKSPKTETSLKKSMDEIPLRSYQIELLGKVPDGESTLVSAPPGSGKTLVAAHLMSKALERPSRRIERKYKCKVIFFAPSVALVNQQTEKFENYFGSKYLIDSVHGGEKNDLYFQLSHSDVLCSTPQVLLDAVERKQAEVSLTDFVLLVFDECHHCMGMDPYNRLMRQYLHLKSRGAVGLPQVIGLTATLGIGKTTSLHKGKANIMQICSNLNALGGIATVTENIDDLPQKPPVGKIKLQERVENPFTLKVIETMDGIIKKLEELDVYSYFSSSPMLKNFMDLKKGTFQLDQNCSILEKLLNESEFPKPRDAHAYNEYLQKYNKGLDIQGKLRPEDCINFLKKFMENEEERTGKVENSTEEKLFAILQETIPLLEELSKLPECQNQYLELIEKQIVQQFNQLSESRVMVMVEERLQTVAMKKWMNSNDNLKQFHAEYFVGVAQKNQDNVGMDEKRQLVVMDGFKEGRHKILICTNEASGEGIDVQNCNMVLCYNYSKNEIGLVQQAGRVRDKDGKVVKLSTADVQKRDEKNMYKVMLMEEATEAVRHYYATNKDKYINQLKKLQKEFVTQYQQNIARMLKRQQQQVNDKEYRMHCRKCRVDVCSSKDVRRVFDGDEPVDEIAMLNGAKYINISEEFRTKYKARTHPKIQPMGPDWNKTNKIACESCGKAWGIEGQWRGMFEYPLMKIDGFRIVDPTNPRNFQVPRQWQNACFVPPIIRLQDLDNSSSNEMHQDQEL